MKPALLLVMMAGGALLIRYAFLGRNPWDDILTVLRGEPSKPPNVSTDASANPTSVPIGSTVGNQGGTVRSVTGSN